jgi:hypothetical protein
MDSKQYFWLDCHEWSVTLASSVDGLCDLVVVVTGARARCSHSPGPFEVPFVLCTLGTQKATVFRLVSSKPASNTWKLRPFMLGT